MWPGVLRGQNIITIGGPETGKTLGFLAPLASNMLDHGLYNEVGTFTSKIIQVKLKIQQESRN